MKSSQTKMGLRSFAAAAAVALLMFALWKVALKNPFVKFDSSANAARAFWNLGVIAFLLLGALLPLAAGVAVWVYTSWSEFRQENETKWNSLPNSVQRMEDRINQRIDRRASADLIKVVVQTIVQLVERVNEDVEKGDALELPQELLALIPPPQPEPVPVVQPTPPANAGLPQTQEDLDKYVEGKIAAALEKFTAAPNKPDPEPPGPNSDPAGQKSTPPA